MTRNLLPPVDAVTQASWFANVRAAHQMETTEDYVEMIAQLLDTSNEARLSDIAARMGVSRPTVSKMLDRLQAEGYIESQPYRAVFLTPKGRDLARKCQKRHSVVYEFLLRLGIDPDTAALDAEGIEHHLSAKSLKIMENFKG
ncbi:MAG: manganese-binding transcriptional regulator MntR [Pseudomonadota bacterium]